MPDSGSPQAGTDQPLLLTRQGPIARLTLNRPRQLNALSEVMLASLAEALAELARDEGVRVVILGAEGRAFSAGHDLKEMRQRPEQAYYDDLFARCSAVMLALHRLPQPVIAQVQGIATAAGCQLAATCDLVVAARSARFATSGINVGLFCSTPAVAVSRALPAKAAFEMLMTGDFVSAEEAHRLGLVNRVAEDDALAAETEALAAKIAAKSGPAIRLGKKLFYDQLALPLEEAYRVAAERMACNMMTEDAGHGIDAFMAKQAPDWRHK